jgi:SAM-dependent methyltransferase
MSFTLDDVAFLVSEFGQHVLAEYANVDGSENNTLQLITELRKSLTLEQASAVLTTIRLRQKAVDKFPIFADKMLFTEDSLQQASDARIRQYRAHLLASQSVLDVCCSIGSDALAFAQVGHSVLGLDIDPIRIELARHNATLMNLDVQFDVADVTQSVPDNFDLIFFDPARRTSDGKRIFNIEQYIPPVSLIHQFQAKEIAVKLSPAVDLTQLESYGGQVEFISVNGALKEAVLWKKRLSSRPIATLISDKICHFEYAYDATVAITAPKQWLFEPDSSILRAGLVQNLALTLDATMLDDTIAYLTLDKHVLTPWGRYWRILDWMPFNLKKLRRYLIEHNVRHLTVKKRGFPMSPEEVIAKLKLKKGTESRVLVMTRLQGKPIVIICSEN